MGNVVTGKAHRTGPGQRGAIRLASLEQMCYTCDREVPRGGVGVSVRGSIWVQENLFGEPGVQTVAARRAARPGLLRQRRRPNTVRVTSDPNVARSWDASHQLSSMVTWQLARTISDSQLAQLRERLGRSLRATEFARISA
jgi:hypothetical protein